MNPLFISSFPLGQWVEVPFNSENFTASGSMTWTVAAANQAAYNYTRLGRTMILNWILQGTTIEGTVSNSLLLKIPENGTAAARAVSLFRMVDNGTRVVGYAFVEAGSTTVRLRRWDEANLTLSTSATSMDGQIAFDVIIP